METVWAVWFIPNCSGGPWTFAGICRDRDAVVEFVGNRGALDIRHETSNTITMEVDIRDQAYIFQAALMGVWHPGLEYEDMARSGAQV